MSFCENGNVYLSFSTYGIIGEKTGNPDIVVCILDSDGSTISTIQNSSFNKKFMCLNPTICAFPSGTAVVSYYSIDSTVSPVTQELIVFQLSNVVCVVGETEILVENSEFIEIKNIQRGEFVVPRNIVSKRCEMVLSRDSLIDLMVFSKDCLGVGKPYKDLIITPNHPVFYNNARRPAKSFINCPGVKLYKSTKACEIPQLNIGNAESFKLYDLQFDFDSSYIANGIRIQSRSPTSCISPLLKNEYNDESLWSPEKTWDSIEQDFPLIDEILHFNRVLYKNKKHLKVE
jgi:hypothetical protein